MRNLFVVVVLVYCIVTIIEAKSVDSSEDVKNCIAGFLKHKDLLETGFPEGAYTSADCDSTILKLQNDMYSNKLKELTHNDETIKDAECVIEMLRSSKTSDYFLMAKNLEASKHLSKQQKEQKTKEILKNQEDLLNNVKVKCSSTRLSAEKFAILLHAHEDSSFDPKEAYCLRKHVVDHNLIEMDNYHVKLNKKNIDVAGINCGPVMEDLTKTVKETLTNCFKTEDKTRSSKKIECMVQKSMDNNYANKTWAVIVLGELKMSDKQKKDERKRYIETMLRINKIIENGC